MPTSTPYSGLKKIHIFGDIISEECGNAISSIILHQSGIEDLEIMCTSKKLTLNYILDPIMDIFSQPQLQSFACKGWKDYDFEVIFRQFLESNRDFEISASVGGHEVVIPARNPDSYPLCQKTLRFYFHFYNKSSKGIIFSWLQKAKVEGPLKLIKIEQQSLAVPYVRLVSDSFLSTCQALNFTSGIQPYYIQWQSSHQ